MVEDILHPDTADLAPRPDQVEGQLERIRVAHYLHHHIGSPALRYLLDLAHGIVLEIDHLGPQLPRLFQALRHGIDGVDGVDHGQRAGDGADAHGPAPDDHGRELLAIALVEILQEPRGGKVARREDVRHQHQHLFGDVGGCLDKGAVGQRAPDVLGLAAVDGVGRDRVAEEFAFDAAGGLAAYAVEAFAAGGVERDDDLRTGEGEFRGEEGKGGE